MAKRSSSPGQMLTAALFVFYLIALTWIIVCKMALPGDALPHLRSVNLIPFGEPLLVNGQADYSEAVQNCPGVRAVRHLSGHAAARPPAVEAPAAGRPGQPSL